MANTSVRTLRLLSLLQARRYWPGEELAGQLQVSPRTLRRDIDRLRELGYPIQAQRGVAGGYQLAAGTALPPLVVDDEEAVALALGRQASPNGTGVRFRARELPAADAAAFVRAGVQSTRTGYDIEVIVEAPAEVVRERIGRWASVSEISASRCRVRMTADALEWPVLGLGMVGAEFQVISPPELIDWMRDWGARFSRAGQGSGPRTGPE